MSVPQEVKPVSKRKFDRVWLPCLILAGTVIAITAIWLWPSEAFERSRRGTGTIMTIQVSLLLLTVWLIFLSGLRWRTRGGILLLAVLTLLLAYWNVQFDGDMVPSFPVWTRWTRAGRLESHRQSQARGGEVKAIEVTEGSPTDFPEYRGRKRDGVVSAGPPLARDWKTPPA